MLYPRKKDRYIVIQALVGYLFFLQIKKLSFRIVPTILDWKFSVEVAVQDKSQDFKLNYHVEQKYCTCREEEEIVVVFCMFFSSKKASYHCS